MRILVVDDVEDNVEILNARLSSRGYEVITAMNGPQALDRVDEQPPHLILLDVMMPGMDGHEVARRIKANEALPFIPIILVTALTETEDVVQGLESGADDYISKPYNFNELEARMRAMLRVKRLQDELDLKNRELEDANIRLKKLSITDGLTELFNHRHVHELLHDEFERARRTQEPLAISMIDLDKFKSVNDTHGHPTGDVILFETARILRETAREIDMVGRYGGEEFIVILPNTDEAEAAAFAERVRAAVESHVYRDGPVVVRMTTSCGVAAAAGGVASSPEDLLKLADEALYQAKHGGRNQVVRASQSDGTGPDNPAPSDPAPSDPAPSDSAPSDPAPSDRAPADPAPADSASSASASASAEGGSPEASSSPSDSSGASSTGSAPSGAGSSESASDGAAPSSSEPPAPPRE